MLDPRQLSEIPNKMKSSTRNQTLLLQIPSSDSLTLNTPSHVQHPQPNSPLTISKPFPNQRSTPMHQTLSRSITKMFRDQYMETFEIGSKHRPLQQKKSTTELEIDEAFQEEEEIKESLVESSSPKHRDWSVIEKNVQGIKVLRHKQNVDIDLRKEKMKKMRQKTKEVIEVDDSHSEIQPQVVTIEDTQQTTQSVLRNFQILAQPTQQTTSSNEYVTTDSNTQNRRPSYNPLSPTTNNKISFIKALEARFTPKNATLPVKHASVTKSNAKVQVASPKGYLTKTNFKEYLLQQKECIKSHNNNQQLQSLLQDLDSKTHKKSLKNSQIFTKHRRSQPLLPQQNQTTDKKRYFIKKEFVGAKTSNNINKDDLRTYLQKTQKQSLTDNFEVRNMDELAEKFFEISKSFMGSTSQSGAAVPFALRASFVDKTISAVTVDSRLQNMSKDQTVMRNSNGSILQLDQTRVLPRIKSLKMDREGFQTKIKQGKVVRTVTVSPTGSFQTTTQPSLLSPPSEAITQTSSYIAPLMIRHKQFVGSRGCDLQQNKFLAQYSSSRFNPPIFYMYKRQKVGTHSQQMLRGQSLSQRFKSFETLQLK